jgi:MEMO1 family protein
MRWPTPGRPTGSIGVRRAAVAGRFYEDRPDRLASLVDHQLAQARADLPRTSLGRRRALGSPGGVVAIIVPHAGHIYSGPVAAFAYAALDPTRVRRVVLLGPAHFVPVPGIGLSTADAWRTPLGDVPLDVATATLLRGRFDDVFPADEAHAPEHSLEVQLPFLQRVLGTVGWSLLPLIVGADMPDEVADVIRTCAALPGTLVVVSSDLSHYLDHDTARARDDRTIAAILARRPEGVGVHDACGRYPLRGLLTAAAELGWELDLLDARTSGDTAGSRDRVVGYAAFAAWSDEGTPGSSTDAAAGTADGAPAQSASPGASTPPATAAAPTPPAAAASPTLARSCRHRRAPPCCDWLGTPSRRPWPRVAGRGSTSPRGGPPCPTRR